METIIENCQKTCAYVLIPIIFIFYIWKAPACAPVLGTIIVHLNVGANNAQIHDDVQKQPKDWAEPEDVGPMISSRILPVTISLLSSEESCDNAIQGPCIKRSKEKQAVSMPIHTHVNINRVIYTLGCYNSYTTLHTHIQPQINKRIPVINDACWIGLIGVVIQSAIEHVADMVATFIAAAAQIGFCC